MMVSENKRIWIFYSESEKELKESVKRYIKFVKKQEKIGFIELSNFKKQNYFEKIYPYRFKNSELYFIFDKELNLLVEVENENKQKEKKLSPSGLAFSIMTDLCEEGIEIYAFKWDVECYEKINDVKSCGKFSECGSFIKIEEIMIKEYGKLTEAVAHRHKEIKDEDRREIKKRLRESSKWLRTSKEENKKGNKGKNCFKGFEEILKNYVFILIIDDVLGDYTKTFLPFYTFIKSRLRNKGKKIIMRGMTELLLDKIEDFPADIILVDIDFSKVKNRWEKELRYKYYYIDEPELLGVEIYNQLLRIGPLKYTKKRISPEVIIFTGIFIEDKKEDLKGIKCIKKNEINELENEIQKCQPWEKCEGKSYFSGEIEDVYKKLVYIKKYELFLEVKERCEKLIWDTISIAESVKQNWEYFNEIRKKLKEENIAIYTGLEGIEFNGEEKPICGDRIEEIEENKRNESKP
ncbi:MAG: hypothetical protein DRP29_07520 [Thermodesulfobacteriota bacterium]|nr:MAG: hypothetical protein DRP29_07520 [Thermodesulfobacteriota bacterium]